ncbi:MAG: hypothetical protein GX442_19010 [Candidatus Riflebacteria bacterium]|nr:hypothetical protein [Candidatus Riflebacteria bacterium]
MADRDNHKDQPSSPTPGTDEAERLTGQIETWIRQRSHLLERMQQNAPPAAPAPAPEPAAPPQEALNRRIEQLAAENLELRQRLAERDKNPPPAPAAPRRPSISEADFQSLQNQNAILRARVSRLEAVQDSSLAQKTAAEEHLKKMQADLGQAKTLLAERERFIDQLKVRLADAVLEQNRLANEMREARDDYEKRLREFFQVKAEHAELTQRLESAARNEKTLLEEVHRLSEELRQAREDQVEARHAHEALVKELDQRTIELNRAREVAKKVGDKAVDAEHFRHQLLAAEARERELVAALEGTTAERNRLRDRISRLLTGVQQYVAGPPATLAGESGPPAEPFAPFLPFCFPDRLPQALRLSWTRRLAQDLPPHQAAPSPATLAPRARHGRPHYFQLNLSLPHHLPLLPIPLLEVRLEPRLEEATVMPMLEIGPTPAPAFGFPEDGNVRPLSARQMVPRSCAIHARSLPAPARVYMTPQALPVLTWSTDLYLGFLFSTISHLRQAFARSLEHRPPKPIDHLQMDRSLGRHVDSEKFLRERVAYRDLSRLKFARLPVPRENLVFDFQRRRLQTIFKTFGDSISSMYSRLERMLQPSSPPQEEPPAKKPTGPQEDV